MTDSFYIAWQYITANKMRSATLITCVILIAIIPLTLNLMLKESERQLLSRAESTPLLLGAKGSSLDLVMNGLYFDDETPEPVSMAAVGEVDDSGLAMPIPLYVRFNARRFPIVGTTLDYFDFRGLTIDQGRQLAMLGEAVLGAESAERLGIQAGGNLQSTPETTFDLAGVYPLRMRVVGVLDRSHTADDLAVFVDVKTAWVVQGLIHGHEDPARSEDSSIVIDRTEGNVVASAKLVEYTEITDDNIDRFHFHGDPEQYPLSAVIVVPEDTKSGTILRGRYLGGQSRFQLVVPKTVIDGLLGNIFRIKNVLDAIIAVVGTATILALVLVFALSLRLRQREIQTVFRLGGSRLTIARLLAAEITIILVISTVSCGALILMLNQFSADFVSALLIR